MSIFKLFSLHRLKCSSLLWLNITVISVLLSACDDIIEPDISKDHIEIISPTDSSTSYSVEQQLYWYANSGARQYRLRIASPSLEKPSDYFIDTVISTNRFNIQLIPGVYQWGVQGLNAGYSTPFTFSSFFVDSSSSLESQHLNLVFPAPDKVINNPRVTFEWGSLAMADKYIFQLTSVPKFDTVLYGTTITKVFPNLSQSYSWKVSAINSQSLKESSVRSFSVDVTPPLEPVLTFPRADTTFSQLPVKFNWKRKSSDVLFDSLYIYSSDQISVLPGFPVRVNTEEFVLTSFYALPPGIYFWGVKSIDIADNRSVVLLKRKFAKQ